MDKFDANRRKLLALGGVALGAAILPTPAFATLSTPRPRILTLNNLHTGESIKAEFSMAEAIFRKNWQNLTIFPRLPREQNKVHRPVIIRPVVSPARVVRHPQTGATHFRLSFH